MLKAWYKREHFPIRRMWWLVPRKKKYHFRIKFLHSLYCCALKFIYFEKATRFCKISTLLLSYVVPVKRKVEISQNFVALSEYMNFTTPTISQIRACFVSIESKKIKRGYTWRVTCHLIMRTNIKQEVFILNLICEVVVDITKDL